MKSQAGINFTKATLAELASPRERFGKILRYKGKWTWAAHDNDREQKRDRFILEDELPRFLESLEAEQNRDMRDFF